MSLTEPRLREGRRKVLVIEDEEQIRALIEKILLAEGYSVVSTSDPTSAMELARRENPDLVLCDIAMPALDGYGVLKALQADPATARFPVVFLTAHREFSERVRAFRYGVVDYVTKPFDREILIRKVEGVLRELELDREQIVSHDPPRLPGDPASVPSFEALPEVFRTVLVVDDNEMFRQYLKEVLSRRGFTVYEAGSGDEALRLALQSRPWLILTDVTMPGLDGIELCRSIRRHSLIRHTPLIFLSGWDDYKDRYRGLEAGADEYLSKDTPIRELLIRIQIVLRRYSDLGARSFRGPGMEGRLEVIGVSGLLQTCHLGSLTGVLTMGSGSRAAEVRFQEGEIVAAQAGVRSGQDALLELLGWPEGHFSFAAGDPGPGVPLGSFDKVLLEACRRLDESRR